ncbi:DUF7424 family protein [Rahnella ecdela]|uniref:DUF7424 domain-containing protein n=1 Tax=Rahnella ecdela TaxID=2816250 RepID=A0ABS6LFD1_9GAMM|nr:hypothetical protein [Rahnella ecdela]MBU9845618.1 hypothetical protein [Rahnella ecdela]
MKKIAAICMAVTLLSGCKVDMETTANLADILSEQHKVITGDLNFEVATCNDYEDSRKESKSLVKIKAQVPQIFTNAKFVECYTKKLNSYAHFTIPVDVGAVGKDTKFADTHADIFLSSKKETGLLAGIFVSPNLRKRLAQAKKEMPVDFDFNVRIKIKRTVEPVDVVVMGTYVIGADGKKIPVVMQRVHWNTGDYMTFQLSDVSKDNLFENGIYKILNSPASLQGLVTPR